MFCYENHLLVFVIEVVRCPVRIVEDICESFVDVSVLVAELELVNQLSGKVLILLGEDRPTHNLLRLVGIAGVGAVDRVFRELVQDLSL